MQIAQHARSHSDDAMGGHQKAGHRSESGHIAGKPVSRALCRVQIGESIDYLPWLEKVLKHSPKSENYKELQNLSVMIVDGDARHAMKKRPYDGGTLFDKLSEGGVQFVDTAEVMTFLENKYKSNPIRETLHSLRKLVFADGGGTARFNHLFAEALKAICPSYVFSINNSLDSVAVVDSDSFIPLLPTSQKQLSHKSDHLFSLKANIEISTSSGKKYIVKKAMVDINFLRFLLNLSGLVESFGLGTRINYAFNEVRSQQVADNKTRVVLQTFEQINSFQWGKTDTGNSNPVVTFGLKNLVQKVNGRLTKMCYLRCIDVEKTNIYDCQPVKICSSSASQLESQLIPAQIDTRMVGFAFFHMLSDINTMKTASFRFCCGDKEAQLTPSICNHKNALSLDDCLEKVKNSAQFELLGLSGSSPMEYSLLFKRDDIEKLGFFFSNPFQEWGLQKTEGRYRWDPNRQSLHENPIISVSLGEMHAQEVFLNGNISAITSLRDSSQQPWGETSQRSERLTDQDSEMLTESRDGLINGIMAGLFDECFSRTPLPDYSLLYKTGRGYLFGGGAGMALGLGEHVYKRYVEPALPDTGLKSCLNTLLPKGFIIASALQGRVINAVCATGSYLFVRIIGQKAFPLPSRTRQNISRSLRNAKS